MTREIKFRAYSNEHNRYCDNVTFDELGRWIGWIKASGVYLTTADIVLEQYTGLKDKNGKEIYEGDVLDTCCGKAKVYFDEEYYSYRVWQKHGTTMPLVGKKSQRHFEYEVIGNVHEDSERS